MVECGSLENCCACKGTESSNLSLSAKNPLPSIIYRCRTVFGVIDLNATTVMREQMAKETRVRGYGPGQVHPLGELIQVAEVALAAE